MTKHFAFLSVTGLIMALALAFAFGSLAPMAHAQTFTDPDDLQAGDLIRGESYSAVYYYGEDGFRYVFPNDKTYFTWYEDFDDVVWLTDSNLSSIQIGGNVTYRPGVKMIKINSDPKVYAVAAGGTLRHVTTEQIAIDLYGSSWNKQIDDVPDGFFPNYEIGTSIDVSSSFSPQLEVVDAESISVDKDLPLYVTVHISDNAYSETTLEVPAGTPVRFVNDGANKHSASADDGDWGTGTLAAGKHFTRYFDEEGEYDYHCAYHSSMKATIVVE